jgi:hypothetical protein
MQNGNSAWFGPLGQLVTIVATIVAGAVAVSMQLHAIDIRLVNLEAGVADRWTGSNQTIWSYELRESNTGLIVPDPRDVMDHNRRGRGR